MIIGKFASYTLGKASLSLNSVTNQAKGGIVRGKSRQALNFYCCVLSYVHGKHLWSCRDGQLTCCDHTFPGQA